MVIAGFLLAIGVGAPAARGGWRRSAPPGRAPCYPNARAVRGVLALGLVVALGLGAAPAPAAEPFVAWSADRATAARLPAGAGSLRFERGGSLPIEVPLPGLGTVDSLHLDATGRFAFVTCEEPEAAVVVVDQSERRVRVVPSGELFSLGERMRVGRPWHRPRGAFVSSGRALLFLDTPVGVKAVPAAQGERPRTASADDLRACLASIARGTHAWVTAIRGLEAAGAGSSIAAELDALLDHLIERPHEDRELSLSVYDVLETCFGNDDRLAEPSYVSRLLAVYMRFDRTRIRRLFAGGPGRQAITPLRAIMDDAAQPMHDRVAAASCLMAVSSFRRSDCFEFALASLAHPSADAREESYAVLTWFAGLELLRYRGEVEQAILDALAHGDGRGDRAQKLIVDGLVGKRSRSHAEPLVLDQLARADLPIEARRALLGALAAPAHAPEEPVEVGDRIALELDSADAVARDHALGAMRELRRHVDSIGAPPPFAAPAEARAWWTAARARAAD